MNALFVLLALIPRSDRLRVEGPPFLVPGETAVLRAESAVADALPVWRIAAAPGLLETVPSLEPGQSSVRGTDRFEVRCRAEGEILISVTLERRGVRVASVEHRLRVGPVLRVRAWCRIVDHPRGGTARGAFFRDADCRRELEAKVNRYLRPLGIEVALDLGPDVAGADDWFDKDGRFRPVVLKDGEKAHSASLRQLLKHDRPEGLNVYLVRDCHWTEVQEGFRRVVVEHSLAGVGMKDGQVVLDDSADEAALAHELGHAFSLDDLRADSERGRLMYTIRRDRTGSAFTWQEMRDARERALLHLRAHAAPRR